MNYRTFSDEKILLGLCVGEYALKADLMTDKEILEDALEVLNTVWEDDVGDVKKIIRTSWLTEPYFMGAYSFPSTQSSEEDFENFSESINDQIFFCGEHTNLKLTLNMEHRMYAIYIRFAEVLGMRRRRTAAGGEGIRRK